MTYGVVVTVPAPMEVYEATHAEVLRAQGDEPVDDLLVHYARPTPEGFQVVEIWTSKQASDRFNEAVVRPVVARMGAGAPQAVAEEFEVHGLITGRALTPS
jgi:hypothetical protein